MCLTSRRYFVPKERAGAAGVGGGFAARLLPVPSPVACQPYQLDHHQNGEPSISRLTRTAMTAAFVAVD